MPTVTRFFVRTALLYLVAALVAGLILAAQQLLNLPPAVLAIHPVYFHLFMVGWVTQLIIGVAYWMFPQFMRKRPRGFDVLAWATYVLLNVGLLLRVVAEPAQTLQPNVAWGWLLALSALTQWLAGVIFVINTWPRVKER